MDAGGYGSSTSFKLFGAISQISTGTSTTASFNLNAGFLYFPFASSPVVGATAGNGQVSLTWSASQGFLGWNPSGYSVGQTTASGGPYSFTSVGNVTSSTRTGLTNGTAYYFVIRALDAFNNSIATSTEVSATPVAPPPSGGGGGGGGGYVAPAPATSVIFSGRAYPKSTVTLLKDAQIAATTIAGADANFQISISGLAGGNYIFSIYSEDNKGLRSSLLTFPVSVTSGATTNVSGIFISPTIAVDKDEVKLGDTISIFGQSVPSAEILINVNSEPEFFFRIKATLDGAYLHQVDTMSLSMGSHFAKSKASTLDGAISPFSKAVGFLVGTKNIAAAAPTKCPAKADLNNDCRVNLVDFSIAAYWYKRSISAAFADKEKTLLNSDNKVNLVDFSIMAFYWTG